LLTQGEKIAWVGRMAEAPPIPDDARVVDDAGKTLVVATKWGRELMRMEDQIGTLEAAKLADLLLVDGNPLENICLLQEKARLALVMQGGQAKAGTLGRQHAGEN
jgi:imidazolonepropionase-like amidohydrolase